MINKDQYAKLVKSVSAEKFVRLEYDDAEEVCVVVASYIKNDVIIECRNRLHYEHMKKGISHVPFIYTLLTALSSLGQSFKTRYTETQNKDEMLLVAFSDMDIPQMVGRLLKWNDKEC